MSETDREAPRKVANVPSLLRRSLYPLYAVGVSAALVLTGCSSESLQRMEPTPASSPAEKPVTPVPTIARIPTPEPTPTAQELQRRQDEAVIEKEVSYLDMFLTPGFMEARSNLWRFGGINAETVFTRNGGLIKVAFQGAVLHPVNNTDWYRTEIRHNPILSPQQLHTSQFEVRGTLDEEALKSYHPLLPKTITRHQAVYTDTLLRSLGALAKSRGFDLAQPLETQTKGGDILEVDRLLKEYQDFSRSRAKLLANLLTYFEIRPLMDRYSNGAPLFIGNDRLQNPSINHKPFYGDGVFIVLELFLGNEFAKFKTFSEFQTAYPSLDRVPNWKKFEERALQTLAGNPNTPTSLPGTAI